MKILSLPTFKRPREKLQEKGPDALKDYELLAILLRTGYQGKSAIQVAKRILDQYTINQLSQLKLDQLSKLKGIGPSRASTIIAGFHLYKRCDPNHQIISINSPEDVYKTTHFLTQKTKEHLHALYLNARNQLITQQTISIGTIDCSIAHPREIYYPAIKNNAVQIIITHNHPSGDPTPSPQDISITKKIKHAGSILGIELIDHIIITKTTYHSLKQNNQL